MFLLMYMIYACHVLLLNTCSVSFVNIKLFSSLKLLISLLYCICHLIYHCYFLGNIYKKIVFFILRVAHFRAVIFLLQKTIFVGFLCSPWPVQGLPVTDKAMWIQGFFSSRTCNRHRYAFWLGDLEFLLAEGELSLWLISWEFVRDSFLVLHGLTETA